MFFPFLKHTRFISPTSGPQRRKRRLSHTRAGMAVLFLHSSWPIRSKNSLLGKNS